MIDTEFEKLGVFYLGRKFDIEARKPLEEPVLYESRDLVTHAVCIGMTGSGKTGLCLGLVEEAAIDGIPVIAIDIKGDLTNLLLNFPSMQAADLEPWLDTRQARQQGISVEQLARERAVQFRKDLTESGQSLERIAKLRDSNETVVFTPGSSAGVSVSALRSFDAPSPEVMDDTDALRERINSSITSILVLLGIEADPLQSREHILLANILKSLWQENKSIELADLVHLIQKPPITRIGAIDLESIFPAKERFEFAMRLNNLLASPGFEVWMQGEPLEIDQILYSANGKPRTSIFYIAHLNDTERMFFVTLLLNRIVAWMRSQSGTSSLRALLFMDEIFGYFPPVANPPSKQPLLTLLKQARAFGLGVMLATQNPVDIDYKGLSNAGTWFIGRLQTERDKARVLDGLEGVSASSGTQFDRQRTDTLLSSLSSRVFLMNNVHDDAPQLFKTRTTLSFLAGPLTTDQLKRLTRGTKTAAPKAEPSPLETPQKPAASPKPSNSQPLLPPDIRTCFLPVRTTAPASAQLVYSPNLIAVGNVRFVDTKTSVDSTLQYCLLATTSGDLAQVEWEQSQAAKVWMEDLENSPQPTAIFESPPSAMTIAKNYATWTKDFTNWLYASKNVRVFKSDTTGEFSKPRESERDFRIRLAQTSREKRDEAVQALKAKWAPKLATLEDKVHRAEQKVEQEQAEARNQQFNSAVNLGATVLGAFVGRRRVGVGALTRASSTARSMNRAAKEQQDIQHAEESLDRLRQQAADLDAQFAAEMTAIDGKFDPLSAKLTEIAVSPKKTNITIPLFAFAWTPFWRLPSGEMKPAWIRNEVAQ